MGIFLSFIATLAIIFIIPILVYGLFAAFFKLKEPTKKRRFFISVLVQKVGTSIGFAWLFYLGKDIFIENWLIYSLVWFVMFSIVEVGQALLPNYSKKEAVAGVVSELIYFPTAALVVSKLVLL